VIAALQRVSRTLQIAQFSLGFIGTPKGHAAGALRRSVFVRSNMLRSCGAGCFTSCYNGKTKDHSKDGEELLISGNLDRNRLTRYRVARGVLIIIIEKWSVYHSLLRARIWEKFPCIIVTGKGMPDIATLQFTWFLQDSRPLAERTDTDVLGLFDWNPSGLTIQSTYRFGSNSIRLDNVGYVCSVLALAAWHKLRGLWWLQVGAPCPEVVGPQEQSDPGGCS
jgi:DNA topoisomerase VI subunit A